MFLEAFPTEEQKPRTALLCLEEAVCPVWTAAPLYVSRAHLSPRDVSPVPEYGPDHTLVAGRRGQRAVVAEELPQLQGEKLSHVEGVYQGFLIWGRREEDFPSPQDEGPGKGAPTCCNPGLPLVRASSLTSVFLVLGMTGDSPFSLTSCR